MKKKLSVAGLVMGVFLLLFSVGSSLAFQCDGMTVTYVGGSDFVGSGVGMWVRNDTGAACGDIAAGGTQQFVVANNANSDKKLAIILTAVSLGKKVYIATSGTGAQGEAVTVVSMSN